MYQVDEFEMNCLHTYRDTRCTKFVADRIIDKCIISENFVNRCMLDASTCNMTHVTMWIYCKLVVLVEC